MESRSSKWPARLALLISILMFGAVMGPLSAFGQTADVPSALQTTSSASASTSASPSASPTPCRFSPAPAPLCPSSSASASGSGSPTPSGSPTGGDGETYDSNLTIAYGADKFSGAVKTNAKCKPGRKVIVRKIQKGPDLLVGRDTTNRRGRWSVGEPDADRGRYYAKVLKRVYTLADTPITCRGDRSPNVRVA